MRQVSVDPFAEAIEHINWGSFPIEYWEEDGMHRAAMSASESMATMVRPGDIMGLGSTEDDPVQDYVIIGVNRVRNVIYMERSWTVSS
jgi:monomeric isocitrate dehydrogenase